MASLADRLAALIAEKGISLRELGRNVGISHVSISRWLKGDSSTPSDQNLESIAKFFAVRPSWLKYGEGEQKDIPASNIKAFVAGKEAPPPGFACIKEFSLRLHAGDKENPEPEWEEVENGEDYWYQLQFFQKQGVRPERCKRARVRGDSMSPFILDGDHVLFAEETSTLPRDAQIIDGYVYVMSISGVMRVKRLATDKDGLVVRSDNTAYPIEHYTWDECVENYIQIYGRVLEISRNANRRF